ncbi:MAG: glycosyltransferase [Bacteroidales bacterium]|nr:glycosyltransferase [Bacteroidales bacterium]
MRVALFIDTFYPMLDGVYKVVDNYARRLNNKCEELTVYCPHYNGWSEEDDKREFPYPIVRCGSVPLPNVDYSIPLPMLDIPYIAELLNKKYDIVHIHSPFSVAMSGVRYAKFKKIPIVSTLHSQFRQNVEKLVNIKPVIDFAMYGIMNTFNQSCECWAVNEEVRKLFVEEYGLKAPSKVQLNATDHMPVADPVAAAAHVNEKYSIDPDENVFLFTGRINFIKNIDFIIRALDILKQKGEHFKMLFVGKGQDEEKLMKLVNQHSLEENVILCGQVSDIHDLEAIYSRATLFLFPSLYDANSIVQIEAACQKTPTVFLEGARTAGTVTNDVNGFIVSPATEEAYAERIISILHQPEYYKKVSEGCFRDLYKNWDDVVDIVYNDYQEIIERFNSTRN